MKSISLQLSIVAGALVAPDLAQAHPGLHANGFVAGITHPLTGADHVLAMIAVGLWAAALGGKARWIVPASFVTAMAAGALGGFAGIGLPANEYAIAASVVALGLLVGLQVRIPTAAAAVVVGLFALAHGYAHAFEMPAQHGVMAFGVGFLAATIGLHAIGLGFGAQISQGRGARFVGAAMAAAGAYFVAVA